MQEEVINWKARVEAAEARAGAAEARAEAAEARIVKLEAKLNELLARLEQDSSNSHRPLFFRFSRQKTSEAHLRKKIFRQKAGRATGTQRTAQSSSPI